MQWRNAALIVFMLLGGWSCSRDPNVAKQKYLESGNRYFDRGKYKEAVIMYQNALRKDMKFGDAYYRLALAESRMGSNYWLSAVRHLRRAVETLPPDSPHLQDAQVKLADLLLPAYLTHPRRPPAVRQEIETLADTLLKRHPDSIDGLRLRGYLVLLADNNYKEAIALLSRAHQIKPFVPSVVQALIQALLGDNRPAEAEQLAKEMISREKTYRPIYDLLYQYYVRNNRLGDAEAILKSKAANIPKEAWPLIQLASFYAGLQRRQDMQAVLDKLTGNPKDYPEGLRLVGDFYLGLREWDAAIRCYEQGLRADPKQASGFRLRIAEAWVRQGKQPEAMRVLEQVLKDDPKDDAAKAMRASLLIDPRYPDQVRAAVTELQALVGRMPKNPVLRFDLARALVARGDLAQARVQLQEAIKINPGYLAPRLYLTYLHLVSREFSQALQAATDILELDPRNLEAQLMRAEAHMGAGNFQQARQQIMEALKQYPTSPGPLFRLGMLSVRENKYKEAEDIFDKLRRANPADLRPVLALSEVYALQNQFGMAIDLLGAELLKTPDRDDLRVGVANLQVRAGKYDEALANFNRVLQRRPKASDLYISVGETYRVKGDIPSAIANFSKAKDLNPSDARPYVPLAVLLDSTGRKAEAKTVYEQILKLQPDNPIALNNLAYMLAETGGDLDQALGMAQRARQRLPQDPNVADTLGWIYIKKNLSDNAVEIFRDLVAKLPANSTYRYHLGMALYQKGDKVQARKELQAALQSKPSSEEAAKIKELLAKVG